MAALVSHGLFHAATELPHGMLLCNQSSGAVSASFSCANYAFSDTPALALAALGVPLVSACVNPAKSCCSEAYACCAFGRLPVCNAVPSSLISCVIALDVLFLSPLM